MSPFDLHLLDVAILLVVAFGLVRGFATGIVRQVAGLVGIVAAFYVGVQFMQPVGGLLTDSFGLSDSISPLVAFVLLFAAVQLIFFGLARFVEAVIGVLRLTTVNRIAGGLLGAGKVALLLSVCFLALNYVDLPGEDTRQASLFYEPVASALPFTWQVVEEHVPDAASFTAPFTQETDEELVSIQQSESDE